MQTLSYTEIEHAEPTDAGKICLMQVGCAPLAIENLLSECIATANVCGCQARDAETGECRDITEADVETHTDLHYLKSYDLVAVIVGE